MSRSLESTIVIRDVESIAEVREVERLQRDVWGVSDLDVVPLSHLIAAKASGGVLIGAFDSDRMAGFVYGFVGHERGVTVHHSHLLAVEPEYRGHDLGFRLKCEQRLRVLDQGINMMTWTFDPLQSRNANFNFRKLGVVADKYFPDFYGPDAESFLHQNGTDRLWVSWHISSERVERRLAGERKYDPPTDLPVLLAACETRAPQLANPKSAFAADRFMIEIPRDIGAIEREGGKLASNWRTATREAFTAAIDAEYIVEEFYPNSRGTFETGSYLLCRNQGQYGW